jgi:hypothetical protein
MGNGIRKEGTMRKATDEKSDGSEAEASIDFEGEKTSSLHFIFSFSF